MNATFDKSMVDVAADVAEMAECMQMKAVARRMAACTFIIFKYSASYRVIKEDIHVSEKGSHAFTEIDNY